MLTPLKSFLLVYTCYDNSISVSICHCFHAKQANIGKIITF